MAAQPLSEAVVYAIDDEIHNLELLRRTLHRTCRLETFSDANAALAAARSKKPDLVLLDFRMPGRNGAEVLADFRSAGVDCAAVFVTAFPEEQAVQKTVKENDALWVVAKPWSPEHLCSQVNMALSLARLRKRNAGK
jgi:response regulator RpfG family c-di-GMP phosphodiesterase